MKKLLSLLFVSVLLASCEMAPDALISISFSTTDSMDKTPAGSRMIASQTDLFKVKVTSETGEILADEFIAREPDAVYTFFAETGKTYSIDVNAYDDDGQTVLTAGSAVITTSEGQNSVLIRLLPVSPLELNTSYTINPGETILLAAEASGGSQYYMFVFATEGYSYRVFDSAGSEFDFDDISVFSTETQFYLTCPGSGTVTLYFSFENTQSTAFSNINFTGLSSFP